MSFSVGIIGLPNVGKSTLFKALTKKQVDIADYPFTTIKPNIGIVAVPDKRLEKIADIVRPEKITKTFIKFIDIAGLVKGAHQGQGMGNQFLSHIRPCNALVEVVKTFKGSDPEQDTKIIENELLMKDQELGDNELSSKPKIRVFNIREQKTVNKEQELKKMFSVHCSLFIDLKFENEISELSEKEIKELSLKSQLNQLILACYNILELITFFTITGKKETKAWTLKQSSNIIEAGAKVHTDFAEKFIKAKVIPWQELKPGACWKIVGKDHIVQDGDIIEFKI